MKDDVGTPLGGPGGKSGDPHHDRPDDRNAAVSGDGAATSADDGDWLDSEHFARVTRVSACDSARARKHAAEAEIARLLDDEQVLEAQHRALGDAEHVDAIRHSGWFPYAASILASARLAWILDAVLWAALWLGVWAQVVRTYRHG